MGVGGCWISGGPSHLDAEARVCWREAQGNMDTPCGRMDWFVGQFRRFCGRTIQSSEHVRGGGWPWDARLIGRHPMRGSWSVPQYCVRSALPLRQNDTRWGPEAGSHLKVVCWTQARRWSLRRSGRFLAAVVHPTGSRRRLCSNHFAGKFNRNLAVEGLTQLPSGSGRKPSPPTAHQFGAAFRTRG